MKKIFLIGIMVATVVGVRASVTVALSGEVTISAAYSRELGGRKVSSVEVLSIDPSNGTYTFRLFDKVLGCSAAGVASEANAAADIEAEITKGEG